MTKAGAGRLIAEPQLTGERLAKEIFSLVDNPQETAELGTNARNLAHPEAAREIVNLIEEAARRASHIETGT
jgi:UDP-N-acetylglucosamine:LPS N-acetylglucosamine transferase